MQSVHKVISAIAAAGIVLVPAVLMAHVEGPDPGYTGAPGENQFACASCHTNSTQGGPVNAAGGQVTATFSSGSTYTPGGAPISITVNVTDPSNTHFGFQMTARLESDLVNGAAGNFTPGQNQIVICGDGTLKASGICSNALVQFIEHSFPSSAQTTPYTFTWTPPDTNVGNVHFYVAGNAVNNNHLADGGDHVYTAAYVLTPAVAATGPTIVKGGVLNSASFAKDASGFGSPVAPGSLVSIFASNFGTQETDASTVPLPDSLGDVVVTIGDTTAPLLNVIPAAGIINAQVPFEVGQSGNTTVVITFNGVASSSQQLTIVPSAPGIFTLPPGAGNAVFVNLSDGTVAAPESAGSTLGVKTRPVNRGEQGLFYATGLGNLTPAIPDGANDTTELHNASLKPVVWIGGVNTGITAEVLFAGQAPQFPGVNQINIVIPENAPAGDAIPIQLQSPDGSVTSPPVATIAIR
ncbi:MAG TPA: choice-of-anchor V domain-containing protein [Bryobacteraceae bacterium]|nr:choice-of-anchor V domain-containing protein [Bryobacteraceae bacterium]